VIPPVPRFDGCQPLIANVFGVKGEKVFYVAAPTEENLNLFLGHLTNPKKSESFFADILPKGQLFRVVVKPDEVNNNPYLHS